MKLKEPLQGIKMIQGHVVMHLTLFIVSWTVDTSVYDKTPLATGLMEDEIPTFYQLKWGHLVTATC